MARKIAATWRGTRPSCRLSTRCGRRWRRLGFAVCHRVDQPWIFGHLLAEVSEFSITDAGLVISAPNDGSQWSETLVSAAFGQALVVLAAKIESAAARETVDAWPESVTGDFEAPDRLPRRCTHQPVVHLPRVEACRDGRRSSPTEWTSGTVAEIGIRLSDRRAPPHHREGRLVTRTVRSCLCSSPTAARRDGSRFEREKSTRVDDIDGRPWPATGAPAVRFAIAMPPDETGKRIGVCERIAEAAQTLGGSISIGDYRLDRRGGTWYRPLHLTTLRRLATSHLARCDLRVGQTRRCTWSRRRCCATSLLTRSAGRRSLVSADAARPIATRACCERIGEVRLRQRTGASTMPYADAWTG